jgi:hypothetical protein
VTGARRHCAGETDLSLEDTLEGALAPVADRFRHRRMDKDGLLSLDAQAHADIRQEIVGRATRFLLAMVRHGWPQHGA